MTTSFTPQAATIVDAYEDGLDTRHLTLALQEPGNHLAPAPGQFCLLSVPGHGEAAFTYVSLPDAEGRFDAVARRVGSLTTALFEVPVGGTLGVRGPFGTGWPLEQLRGRRVLIAAGGCGLAPLACTIDVLVRAGADVVLLVGSRNEASQVLGRERARWHDQVSLVETFDAPASSDHLRGTPVDHLDRACARWGGVPDRVLACGPEVMMNAVALALTARGVASEHVWISLERRMHCGVGLCGHCYVGNGYACVDGPTYRWDALCALREKSPARPAVLTEIHHC